MSDSTPSASEVADVLDRAHDELLVRGWNRWMLHDAKTGAVCANGALTAAVDVKQLEEAFGHYPTTLLGRSENALGCAAAVALAAVLPAVAGELDRDMTPVQAVVGIMAWNDAHCRTFDDVLDALRMAAKHLREQS